MSDTCPKCKSKMNNNNDEKINLRGVNLDKSLLVTYSDPDFGEQYYINKCPRCKHTWDEVKSQKVSKKSVRS